MEKIVSLVLTGLGVLVPYHGGTVQGDSTEAQETPRVHASAPLGQERRLEFAGNRGNGRGDENEPRGATGVRGATGARGVRMEEVRMWNGPTGGSGRWGAGNPQFDQWKKLMQDRLEEFQAVREKFHEQMSERRDEASKSGAKRLDDFKKKLETVANARKKTIVSNVQDRLTQMNTHRTAIMSQQLDKMLSLLEKIVAKAGASGKDTSSVNAAITAARTAITSAQSAVTTQAGKTYVINITNGDTNLKNDADAVMKTLEADLKAVNAQIMTARKAVEDAIKALRTLIGDEHASGTPTVAPTMTPAAP